MTFMERKDAPDAEPVQGEIKSAIEGIARTFEEFKAANDERLKQLEKRGADAVTTAKVDAMNAEIQRRLDDVQKKMNRPQIGGGDSKALTEEQAAHSAEFKSFLRGKVDAEAVNTKAGAVHELKTLVSNVTADGGALVPTPLVSEVNRIAARVVPMRQLARVVNVGGQAFKAARNKGGTASGWVGETGARAETATPSLDLLDIPAQELYAMPAATQTLLDDAFLDVEAWLAEEAAIEFAEKEGAAFFTGNGIAKPKGILSYDNVLDTNYAGENTKVGYTKTLGAAGFASSNPGDALLNLEGTLKTAYRNGARFVMNRKTYAATRLLKDGQGNYLWQPSFQAGTPATLIGYPVTEADDMPDLAANAFSVAFGDFTNAYVIVDRMGVRILRDPFSTKPYVLFYITKRVGGGIRNSEAIKLLKCEA